MFHPQDKAKLKICKQRDPVDPHVVDNMICYARNTVREFRALKHVKNIFSTKKHY